MDERLKPLSFQDMELKDVLKGVMEIKPSKEKGKFKGKKSNKK